jgi:bis(5'-nucleosyl)-tetraphosphatase (symmetrical)
MAHYAIGDLQGCHDEFVALLEALAFTPGRDHLWLTGDLVNRGPRSLATLRAVRDLGDAVSVVLGNHDLHLLAVAHGVARLRDEDTLQDILSAPDRHELLAWLQRQPLMVEDPSRGLAMVHAGLAPQWDLETARRLADDVSRALQADHTGFLGSMYGDQPDRWSPALGGNERLRFAVNCFTRLRVVAADGSLLLRYKGPLAKAPTGSRPWFRFPGRLTAATRIVFGHWSALGYHDQDGVLGLDTGCAWGDRLTAARLDPLGPTTCVSCEDHPRPNFGD